MRGRHLGAEEHADVRPGRELVDQVARHALLERVAAVEDRHAARVGGEEHRRLARPSCPRRRCGRRGRACSAPRCARRRRRCPCPTSRSKPSIASRRHETPQARMIVRARRTSPPSRWTWCVAASIRVIDRVTRISAPSRRACCSARLAARRRRRPTGSRGSSRSATTCPPGRRAPRARPRSCAGPPTRRRRPPRGRRARRRRSRCRTPPPPARSRGRAARPPGAAAAGRRSCRPRRGSPGSRPRPAAARPTARRRRARRAASHRNVIWLRSRKRRSSRARGVPAMAEDDRPGRRRSAADALQAAGPADPVARQLADPLPRPRARPPRRRGSRAARSASRATPRLRGSRAGKTHARARSAPRRRRRRAARSPTTRSTPSTSLTASIRPSSTPNSARSSPSCAAYSPGMSAMSAATRQRRSHSAGREVRRTPRTDAISSGVTMRATAAGPDARSSMHLPAASPSPSGQRYPSRARTRHEVRPAGSGRGCANGRSLTILR